MKIISPEINQWLKDAINWNNESSPLKISNFIPKFDNYVGIVWKVGIIENFPFNDFINKPISEEDIKKNRLIWNNFPQIFNEDSEKGFTEIETNELFKKFKVPFDNYKNDYKLPWNTKAIRVLDNKIIENLSLIIDKIEENKNLILYWEDHYRFNFENNSFEISKEDFLKEIKNTGFDASIYLYSKNKNWCLVNLEDLGFNILAFNDEVKNKTGFLSQIENFKLTEEDELFRYK